MGFVVTYKLAQITSIQYTVSIWFFHVLSWCSTTPILALTSQEAKGFQLNESGIFLQSCSTYAQCNWSGWVLNTDMFLVVTWLHEDIWLCTRTNTIFSWQQVANSFFQEAWQFRRSSSDQKKETLSVASLSETVQEKVGLDSLLTIKHFCTNFVYIETTIKYKVH